MGINCFDISIERDDSVLKNLYAICDRITMSDTALENKIVLAIGIRHKAEAFMIDEITAYNGQLNWKKRSGDSKRFLEHIADSENQTRELLNGYKQFGDNRKIDVLNEVSIMTPENIHINSFMYEPLLDMDIVELLCLYQRVSSL